MLAHDLEGAQLALTITAYGECRGQLGDPVPGPRRTDEDLRIAEESIGLPGDLLQHLAPIGPTETGVGVDADGREGPVEPGERPAEEEPPGRHVFDRTPRMIGRAGHEIGLGQPSDQFGQDGRIVGSIGVEHGDDAAATGRKCLPEREADSSPGFVPEEDDVAAAGGHTLQDLPGAVAAAVIDEYVLEVVSGRHERVGARQPSPELGQRLFLVATGHDERDQDGLHGNGVSGGGPGVPRIGVSDCRERRPGPRSASERTVEENTTGEGLSDVGKLPPRAWQNGSIPTAFIVALLGLLALTWLREGEVIPWRNEFFYLVRLYRTYRPDYIPSDWSLGAGAPEHFLFNHVFGSLALFLPLEAIGLLGRGLSWAANLGLLLLLAGRLGLTPVQAFLPLVVWIGWGQSIIADSWILGSFEAKCVAYALLLAALHAALGGRWSRTGLCTGLCFSFHPSVGLFGGFGVATLVGVAFLSGGRGDSDPAGISRRVPRDLLLGTALCILGALPGLISTIPMALGGHAASASDWELMTLVKMPHHLDPQSWPTRVTFVLPGLLLFNGIHAWSAPERAWRRLFAFQLAIGAAYGLGVLAREIEWYRFLSYFPFRLFPLLTPLFFLYAVADVIGRAFQPHSVERGVGEGRGAKETLGTPGLALVTEASPQVEVPLPVESSGRSLAGPLLGALGALCLLALPDPFSPYAQALGRRLRPTPDIPTGLADCYAWIRDNLPAETEGIAPPGLDREFWIRAERGLVVCSEFQTYDRLPEWRRRVELLGGEMVAGPERRPVLTRHFEAISPSQMESIARDLAPDFLVARSGYPFPILYASGGWVVYDTGSGPAETSGAKGVPKSGRRETSDPVDAASAWAAMVTTS